MRRLISTISKEAAMQTARQMLIHTGQIKPMMSKAECYSLASRRRVDKALSNGALKFVNKGVNTLIKRDDFERWFAKDEWL